MTTTHRLSLWHLALAVCSIATLVACCLAFAPATAQAKEYSMPKTAITATVDADGTLDVTESRTWSFDGSFTCVWWEFKDFGSGTTFQVEGVTLEQGGTTTELSSVPFQTEWRSSGGPGSTCYSVDDAYRGVYLFTRASDETITATLHYKVLGAVTAYNDCAVLYWQFVGSEWAVDSQNVSLELTLPCPTSESAVVGDTLRGWLHGPLEGTIALTDQGEITIWFPNIPSGSYGEVRTTFPTSWLGSGFAGQTKSYNQLDTIIAEEQAWADEANATRARLQLVYFVYFGLMLGGFVVAILLHMRFGREYRPTFKEKYWRDVPAEGLHPLLVRYNKTWGGVYDSDFSVELMHLAAEGAIYLGQGQYQVPPSRYGGSAPLKQDYYLVRLPAADALTHPIDVMALDILFNKVAKGRPSFWFEEISLFGTVHPTEAEAAFRAWKQTIEDCGKALNFFEKPGKRLKGLFTAYFVVLGCLGFVLMGLDELVFGVAAFVNFAICATVVRWMNRRSREANEIQAKTEALKNWLEDFTLLNERLPLDVKVWGRFMVYATMYGITKKVLSQLQVALPQVYNDAMTSTTSNWGVWYIDTHFGSPTQFRSSPLSTFSGSFTSAFSPSSDGDGGGGGSSGGSSGGGGGGGGGGGAR